PALADGAQLHRYSSDQDGVYAFSRIDADERREYVVVTNNSEQTRTVTVPTSSDNTQFTALYGTDGKDKRKSGKDARLDVEVAPLSTVV
ncbi:alpha-glucosidase C-terminal domain-containing protein, partial [Klebsiella pneumoniae]|nr:alpha-glucosidase C-terminal domain-containing protein [Klebsiella pneumoniae]